MYMLIYPYDLFCTNFWNDISFGQVLYPTVVFTAMDSSLTNKYNTILFAGAHY